MLKLNIKMNDNVMKPNGGKTCQAPYDYARYLKIFSKMRDTCLIANLLQLVLYYIAIIN